MSKDGKTPTSKNCRQCPAWPASAFARLSGIELEKLEARKTMKPFQRGDAFSAKGEPTNEVYCLRSGSAKVCLTDEKSGRESLVRLVAPGDMLGYRCIFSADRYRGTASALTESVSCVIDKNTIFDLIERIPDFSLEMLKRMGLELASSEYHHHSFCQKNVRERMAEALLILRSKFGEKSDQGWKINTRLTRADLANWVGASRETVIRTLSEFIDDDLIAQTDDFIYLIDLEALSKISDRPLEAR